MVWQMATAARALVCSDLAATANSLLRIVDSSPALAAVGVAECRGEALEMMGEEPDVVVVDARMDRDAGMTFASRVAGDQLPVLLVVEPGDEEPTRRRVEAQGRNSMLVVSREVVERGDASGDALVRTRLCLLAANGRNARTDPVGVDRRVRRRLGPLLIRPFDAVVLVGSAGTPHLLPRLLPASRVGAAPLLVAVHHNPRFSADFIDWLGELSGREARDYDADAMTRAASGELFAARAEPVPDGCPGTLGPDLGGILLALTGRSLRVLACVASGMDDPVGPGLESVRNGGGHVLTLAADACAQPSMVLAARAAGVVDDEVDVVGMAWVLAAARARATP